MRAHIVIYSLYYIPNDIKLNALQVDYGGEGRVTIKTKLLKNPMYLFDIKEFEIS